MDPVDEVLSELLARPDTEWLAGLDAACAARPEIAQELRRRFCLLERNGLLHLIPSTPTNQDDPERIGPYQLLRRLGSGGMGLVWLARDEALGREVAIKVVRPERLLFANARERFRREVEAVARLRHHGCVQILHVGDHEETPFFAMEYVRGASLDTVLAHVRRKNPGTDPSRLSGADVRQALLAQDEQVESGTAELFAASWNRLCVSTILAATEAVAHAHARGVVHRDVKPSNIMLTPEGRIVVIDFGLAVAEGSGALTKEGSLLGSLAYMAPEQVRGDGETGPRTDVYGLGACLYELLALTPAFPARDEVALRADVLTGKCVPVTRLNAAVGADLAVVVQCAMNVDPERRYASALDFASDLVAVLHDRPIRARRDALAMRARRWSRRHPVLATAVLAATLAALLIPTLVSFAIAGQRDRARVAEAVALRREYTANIAAARSALVAGDGAAARRCLDTCPPELRGFEWNHLALELDGALATLRVGPKPVVRICVRNGLLAAADTSGRIVVARLDPLGALRDLGTCERGAASMAFSDDASELFVLDREGTLSVFDVARGGVVRRRPRGLASERIRLSESIGAIHVELGGARVRSLDPGSLSLGPEVAFDANSWSAEAELVASGSELASTTPQGITIWNVRDGRPVASVERSLTSGILGSSEGFRRIACASDRGIVVWNRGSGCSELGLDGTVPVSVLFPKDDRKVVIVSTKGVVRVHELDGNRPSRTLHGHDGKVTSLGCLAGTNTFLTGGADGTVRLWSTELVNHIDELSEVGEGRAIGVGTDGDLLLGDDNASLFRFAPETGSMTWSADQVHWVVAIAGGVSENRVVTGRGKNLLLWDAVRGEARGRIDLPEIVGDVTKLLVVAPGAEIVAGTSSGFVIRADATALAVREARRVHAQPVVAIAWDADRRRLLSAGADGTVEAHEVATTWASRRLFDAGRPLRALAVSGERFFTAETLAAPPRAFLCERDERDGHLLRETMVSTALNVVRALGDERVVTGSSSGSLAVWDRQQLEPLLELPLFQGTLQDLAVAGTGEWVAAVGYGGVPKLVRAARPSDPGGTDVRNSRLATATARGAAVRALREEIWPPAARRRLEQDETLAPDIRARALRMLPPPNRWGISNHALTVATEAVGSGRSPSSLERLVPVLEDALSFPVQEHEVLTRTALAMVLTRLGRAQEALAALAGLPPEAQLRSAGGPDGLLPHIYFARASAFLSRGDRAGARTEMEKLRALLEERFPADLPAHLLLRELEDALR